MSEGMEAKGGILIVRAVNGYIVEPAGVYSPADRQPTSEEVHVFNSINDLFAFLSEHFETENDNES